MEDCIILCITVLLHEMPEAVSWNLSANLWENVIEQNLFSKVAMQILVLLRCSSVDLVHNLMKNFFEELPLKH